MLNIRLNSLFIPNEVKSTQQIYKQQNNAHFIYNNYSINQFIQPPQTTNHQSESYSFPKFQLLYHVQPHLQQFQPNKVLIQNLNSVIKNNNSYTQTQKTELLDFKKRDFNISHAILQNNVSFLNL